ncbi:MAG: apolipoprotein N-acyltransferase [Halofilum sp. (in: g-proteobacteria)]|nr:apolipoprotein N-acyltransferase [Halofilum sp. (in: g-proteobacteria)]
MPLPASRWQRSKDRLGAAMRSPRGRDALALAAGAAGVLAFAPFGWWPLAVLAPALLFVTWADCRRGRAAWRGWLFGVGYWGAGVYWIYFSLHHFGAAVAPLAALLTVVFALALALTLALLGALVGGGDPRARGVTWFLLVLPGAWILLEWFRSWFMTGFPWLLVGNSQLDTWLVGYAPVLGVYGTGLAVAFTAGALAALHRLRWHGHLGIVVLVAGVWIGGALLSGIHWTRSGGLPFDAALVQGNVDPDEKFADLGRSLDHYTAVTRGVAGEAEMVVWPETAVPTFYRNVAERMNGFAREMEARDTHVITGVFTFGDTRSRYYNAVRQLGAGHRDYRKQHLVPFGEYMPLRTVAALRRALDPDPDVGPRRRRGRPAAVAGRALRDRRRRCATRSPTRASCASRCRRPACSSTSSNDAWFGRSTAPYQHLEIARFRARELGRPLLRATNTGITAIIDHRGRILARGPQFAPVVVEARVEPRAGITPYVRWGDVPAVALAGILALVPVAVGRYRRRRRRV